MYETLKKYADDSWVEIDSCEWDEGRWDEGRCFKIQLTLLSIGQNS
jgi:hypothetical protein